MVTTARVFFLLYPLRVHTIPARNNAGAAGASGGKRAAAHKPIHKSVRE